MNDSSSFRKQFLDIIRDHQGIINSICKIYFFTADDIKDARQDIILQLWKSLPSFRQEAKISTWIYKVALNTVFNKLKREKEYASQISFSESEIDNIQDCPNTDDNFQQLMHIINTLAPIDKAIVILYLEGYNHKEIATLINLTATNISTRFNRIKTKLKTIYNSNSYELR